MKKLVSSLLMFIFILSMGTMAFAEEVAPVVPEEPVIEYCPPNPPDYPDTPKIKVNKLFELVNRGTLSPVEDFEFTITKVSVTDSIYTLDNMPMFNPATFKIPFVAGEATDTNFKEITLPTYNSVGIFTYKITETIGNTAGVEYDVKPLYMKVTVIRDGGLKRVVAFHYGTESGAKTDTFKNKYSAGELRVKKEVTGRLGDIDKYFKVKVKMTAPAGKIVKSTIAVSGGSYATNPTTIAVGVDTFFMIKHGETLKFTNIPYGVTYEVVEDSYMTEGYTTTYNFSDHNKKISKILDTVEIKNDKNPPVDTGIALDSIPYIMLLGFALLGMGVVVFKKRRNAEF